MSLALGFPHPRYLRDCLTSQDITDWLAYEALEPFGASREDVRSGLMVSMYYNAHRKNGSPTKAWYDFFPNVNMPDKGIPEAPVANDPAALSDHFANVMVAVFNQPKGKKK